MNRTSAAGGSSSLPNFTVAASVENIPAATIVSPTNTRAVERATWSARSDRPGLIRRIAAHASGRNANAASTSKNAPITAPVFSSLNVLRTSALVLLSVSLAAPDVSIPATKSTANTTAQPGTTHARVDARRPTRVPAASIGPSPSTAP